MSKTLLEVKDLRTIFHVREGIVPAVDGVSFHINKGETLGIVGESGCGKSQTAFSIMRLVPVPPGEIQRGEILFEDKNLLEHSEDEMRKIRGNMISMIFQEPMTSLNPVYTVGDQIAEVIQLHQGLSKREALDKAVVMLRKVGIPAPEQRVNEYPHQLSGGMRQRVMIAIALACNPKLLIADEPTTALDVTIQAQILELMNDLAKELDMSIMLITHDLGVVAETCDRVVVMYAGKVVEEADAMSLFEKPQHPYTEGLLASIPHLGKRVDRLHVIEGTVPNPLYFPSGCRFNPRCPYATDKCREMEPTLMDTGNGCKVSCWYPLGSREEEVQ